MQDNVVDFLTLQGEHGEFLEAITAFFDMIDKLSAGNTEQVREITRHLADLHSDLGKHMHFEEQEVLPRLVSYTAEIISHCLTLEHEEILASLSELMEEARNFADGSPDKVELRLFQAKFREKMHNIRVLVDDHAHEQGFIFGLVQEMADHELKHKRQPQPKRKNVV